MGEQAVVHGEIMEPTEGGPEDIPAVVDPEKELEVASGGNAIDEVKLFDGSTVVVMRCKMRHAAIVARMVNSVLSGMGVNSIQGMDTIQLDSPQMYMNALETSHEDIVNTLCVLTDMDRDRILDMDIDDIITVIAALVEMNRAFFSTRVSAALKNLALGGEAKRAKK